MPRPLFSLRKDLVPIVQEAGWPPGPVWTGAENLAPKPGFDPRTVHLVASRYADYATRSTYVSEISSILRHCIIYMYIYMCIYKYVYIYIQAIYPHPTSWRSILILSAHLRLGLPSGLVPSGFPSKTLYTPSPHPYAPG